MKFEIINPSDPYEMEADDRQVAAVAVCLLGEGKYALKGLGEHAGSDVPVFLFGGHDEWFREQFGMIAEDTMNHVMGERRDALVRAFDSVTLMREKASSLNDIGGRARDFAVALRKMSVEDAERVSA